MGCDRSVNKNMFREQKHHPAQRAVARLVADRNPTRQTTYLRGKSTARGRQAVARNVNIVVTTNSVKGSFLRPVAKFRGRILSIARAARSGASVCTPEETGWFGKDREIGRLSRPIHPRIGI